jgi:uncharacterized protein
MHPLRLTRSVLDPIHGLIRLTDEELQVANHPVFQRLRKIKQNGLLHLVFPSATHTRFEHSLGALFVADSMLRSLYFNSAVASSKQTESPSEKENSGEAIDFAQVEPRVLEFIFKVTRLAALVHDLGHGPLSHAFDSFAPSMKQINLLFKGKKLRSLNRFKRIFAQYAETHAGESPLVRVPHEVMSCIFFALIWSDIDRKDELTPKVVAAALIGESAFSLVDEAWRPWVSLVHDIVASAPADADRMDYLERDSKSCGVSYGLFDRNRLLKTMLCYQTQGGSYRLGFKMSGYRAVENFVQARFELFVQIYYHKTNRAVQLMLEKIATRATEQKLMVFNARTLDELVEEYVSLSDDLFMDRLRGVGSNAFEDQEVNSVAQSIHNRQFWKRIYDFGEVPQNKRLVPDELMRIVAKGLEQDMLLLDKIPPKATKDLDKGAVLLRRDERGIYSSIAGATWAQVSPILRVLGDEEKSLTRIYLRSSDKKLAGKLRSTALRAESKRLEETVDDGRE